MRHRHIRHGTGRRPLRSASRAPRKPKPRKVNAGSRCPPSPAPGTRPAKQRERAGQVRARLLGGRGGLGLHAPGPRGRQRRQAAERALARLVTATPSAHATATDGRGSVCESLALKLGCQGQRASRSTARSLLRAAVARAGTADTARAPGAPCWRPGAWRSRRGLLREEAGLPGSRCGSTEVQGTGEAAAVMTLSGKAGGGVPQASEGPGPSSQDRSHARGCGRTRQVPGPPLRGSWWQAGSPASAQTRPGGRLGPAAHSPGGAALGTGPGH